MGNIFCFNSDSSKAFGRPSLKNLFLLILTQILWTSPALQAQNRHDRPEPDPYVLENANLKVELGKDRPVIYQYLLKENNGVLPSNPNNSGPSVLFFQGSRSVMRSHTKIAYKASRKDNSIVYHANITYDNKQAIAFDLTYILTGKGINIDFNHVVESNNFYLFNVELPDLISVESTDPVSKLAIPADAGRLIDVKKASIKNYEYEIDWLNSILAGIAYNSKVIGVMDTKSIENHSIVSVYERGDNKFGSFSMRLEHRLREYDLAEFGTVIPATDPKYFLKVQDSCQVEISIAGDYDGDGEVSWVDGSKLLREKVNAVPNAYYQDKTFVRAFLSRKGSTAENVSFDEELGRIKKLAAQTDSAAYVVYLLGWQYSGHDTGYPSVDKVNDSLGGYEKLVNLIREARKYNVNITFYDNYDDSYPDHPGWDADVICRDPQGNLMMGGTWDGEQSYLISSYKYAMKSGLNRVRFTLKRYPVEKAYFIDVLAGGYHGGRKYDFNPSSPAGAVKNFEGKLKIIDEFNKQGLDVATEDFTGFFVGHAGTFGDIVAFDNIYFKDEEQIPLIPLIYHGKTSFGMKVSSRSLNVKTFLYGQRAQSFTSLRSVYTPADYILDALPKQKLYGLPMKSYHRYGDLERIVYEDGSVVETDVKANTYSVRLKDGRVIARNYSSFVPVKKDVYMACSMNGGLISYPVPREWTDTNKIHVFKLNSDGTRNETDFKTENGNISFNSDPNAPYKVVYVE